jgi:hypothetical protein
MWRRKAGLVHSALDGVLGGVAPQQQSVHNLSLGRQALSREKASKAQSPAASKQSPVPRGQQAKPSPPWCHVVPGMHDSIHAGIPRPTSINLIW